jgi:hypothetical protein
MNGNKRSYLLTAGNKDRGDSDHDPKEMRRKGRRNIECEAGKIHAKLCT